MEQLHRDLQSLTAKFAALNAPAKKSRRRRKGASVAAATSGASQPAIVSVTGGAKRRRKKRSALSTMGSGMLTLQRREYLRAVNIGIKGVTELDYIDIVPANFNFLKQFSMFDRVKWNKLTIFYKPGVGSNYNGFVTYGVLWGFDKSVPSDRSGVSSLTPNMSHAIWVDGEPRPLICPQSKLQLKPWYTPDDGGTAGDIVETGPGRIVVAAESPANTNAAKAIVGELWADYSVTLTGTSF